MSAWNSNSLISAALVILWACGGVVLAAAALLPTGLGVCFLCAGILFYRRELRAATSRSAFGFVVLGPAFVAAALAAFAGEHFTAARTLAQLVPKWLPARLFIAYFVGAAHLAAAVSFTCRRYVRWAALCLAIMFALFVLLMDLPASLRHPGVRLDWSLAAREATFSMGALALFAVEVRNRWRRASNTIASIARVWTGMVLVFYGVEHLLYPRLSPGVPDSRATSTWVPFPLAIAYLTGILLIGFGGAMLWRKYSGPAAALAGLLMAVLTMALYVPEYFLARTVPQYVEALNFVFDTLLFSGMLLVVAEAILATRSARIAVSQTAP